MTPISQGHFLENRLFVIGFKALFGRQVVKRLVRQVGVVITDPFGQADFKGKRELYCPHSFRHRCPYKIEKYDKIVIRNRLKSLSFFFSVQFYTLDWKL